MLNNVNIGSLLYLSCYKRSIPTTILLVVWILAVNTVLLVEQFESPRRLDLTDFKKFAN